MKIAAVNYEGWDQGGQYTFSDVSSAQDSSWDEIETEKRAIENK